MPFFDSLTQFPEDPIFSLPILFAADTRPNKVNLGIGSYRDTEGKPYLLNSVKKAEHSLLASERNKEYLPIDGDPAYLKVSRDLIFGSELASQLAGKIYSAQSPGGTGALRTGGSFLCQETSKTIFLPNPTWPNHKGVFTTSGMKIHQYRYYNEASNSLDFGGMCSDIAEMPPGSTILLHTNCHNPTGMDPSFEQWQELSTLIKKQNVIPFFDFAYQGFKESVDADAAPIRYFASQGHELLVANSFSKNFGLYGERVGALNVITTHPDSARKAGSQIKSLIRSNYSNPPKHGAAIITEILSNDSLKKEWIIELDNMRDRLKEMRHTLIAGLQSKGGKKDWSFLNKQSGFFSYSGLNDGQVHRLIKDYGIYMMGNGRFNVAGLNGHNIDYVIAAILEVCEA
jgi:Aspartate/tyrosine/aromatic aminotransferase